MIAQLRAELLELAHALREVSLKHETQAILHRMEEMERRIMSVITQWAEQEQADLTAISGTLDTITTGIKSLDDKITALQNSPGTLTPEDQAALDGIQSASKALVTKAAAISTDAPPTTPPPTP